MYFSRLARYFSGKLPNSEKIDISEFVKMLSNIDIDWAFISEYWSKFGGLKSDYEGLFEAIKNSDQGENKILKILQYFELSRVYIEEIDHSKTPILEENTESLQKWSKNLIDIILLEKFLKKATEDEFARYLMIPLMEEMWFKQLSFYGKVSEKDYWLDMYPVVYETPFWDSQYLWIQFKKTNIGHGSTNTEWQNLKSELEDAFTHNWKHLSLGGSNIKIDGIITITSWKKTALRTDADLHEKFKESYIRIYDHEDIIRWSQIYPIAINLTTKIEKIATWKEK